VSKLETVVGEIEANPAAKLVGVSALNQEAAMFDVTVRGSSVIERMNVFAAPVEPIYKYPKITDFAKGLVSIDYEPLPPPLHGDEICALELRSYCSTSWPYIIMGVYKYREEIGSVESVNRIKVDGVIISEEVGGITRSLFRETSLRIYPSIEIAELACKGVLDISNIHNKVLRNARKGRPLLDGVSEDQRKPHH
jgi:hypothetical protein